jgi:hypothetical protein
MEAHVVGAEAARKARLTRTMKASMIHDHHPPLLSYCQHYLCLSEDMECVTESRELPITDDPLPVDGREHRNVQTDDFLEELADKVFEADVSTQTDSIDDRPPPPVFIPKPVPFFFLHTHPIITNQLTGMLDRLVLVNLQRFNQVTSLISISVWHPFLKYLLAKCTYPPLLASS